MTTKHILRKISNNQEAGGMYFLFLFQKIEVSKTQNRISIDIILHIRHTKNQLVFRFVHHGHKKLFRHTSSKNYSLAGDRMALCSVPLFLLSSSVSLSHILVLVRLNIDSFLRESWLLEVVEASRGIIQSSRVLSNAHQEKVVRCVIKKWKFFLCRSMFFLTKNMFGRAWATKSDYEK